MIKMFVVLLAFTLQINADWKDDLNNKLIKNELVINSTNADTISNIRARLNKDIYKHFNNEGMLFQLAFQGELKDTSIFIEAGKMAEKNSKEMSPCEYYCVYDFGYNYLKSKFIKNLMPDTSIIQEPEFAGGHKPSELYSALSNIKEEKLILCVGYPFNAKLKQLGIEINEANENLLWHALIQYLGIKCKNKIAIKKLFITNMSYYGYDVSGDGGISILQESIYRISQRIRNSEL